MENLTAEITRTSAPQMPPSVPNDKISYQKFLEWNGDEGWFEWVDGEVIRISNPSLRHQDLCDFLTAILRFFVEAKRYGRIISAPFQIKFDFRPSGRQPDIMFVSNENLHRLKKQYVDEKADLIVEIVSPESIERDTQDKFQEYESAGIEEYWIIDPNRRTANFYGFDENGKYKLLPIAANGNFESRVIEGLWINTEWLWQEPLPNLMDVLKEWKLV
ncbi:MAG TPA: Uma2 family endonuclease [Pyrinomonadaceae bacterium]|nr:Uma2 family endonuclease [Pyrinomonadaceae bacterium]